MISKESLKTRDTHIRFCYIPYIENPKWLHKCSCEPYVLATRLVWPPLTFSQQKTLAGKKVKAEQMWQATAYQKRSLSFDVWNLKKEVSLCDGWLQWRGMSTERSNTSQLSVGPASLLLPPTYPSALTKGKWRTSGCWEPSPAGNFPRWHKWPQQQRWGGLHSMVCHTARCA